MKREKKTVRICTKISKGVIHRKQTQVVDRCVGGHEGLGSEVGGLAESARTQGRAGQGRVKA